MKAYDLIIIGTGMGGGTLAYALRDSGRKILMLERGDYLPSEPENWDPQAVFARTRYKPKEQWFDDSGRPFSPGVHYFVGGNTKVYGAALPRFRKEDFAALEHVGGVSPAWPWTYEEFEPYYCRAEQMLFVHGEPGIDPTEPPRSAPFPFPAVPHEPYIEDLRTRLERQGLHPFFLPLGIDLRQEGKCIRCKTCDGFPCKVNAKADADISCVRPALASENVELITRALVRRLITDPSGKRVSDVEIERDGESRRISADTFVVACGAVNSAALLLRSASSLHPNGLANSSGLVGRHYMVHNNTALMAVDPFRINPTTFQKTMAVNDFYFRGEEGYRFPLGNLQLLGKLQAGMLTANQRWVPKPILREFAGRSVDWWIMSEDLPDPENRIILGPGGRIEVRFRSNNVSAHERLIKAAGRMLRRAGFPIVLTQRMGIETNSHQCGTARFGTDPAKSVLDPFCRSHDVTNLLVVDSAFFPSSAAVNPALTIAAQALRVADHLLGGRPATATKVPEAETADQK
ncbi:MAG: GMC family oxidoreductase [Verrucomicrobia bacterium]|nr:GMC family oxidoreductase [Verrucomicrobiota bacterium]MBV8641980.1 GMC family oxidoreductase [Verrucomicrobiota bacterium]